MPQSVSRRTVISGIASAASAAAIPAFGASNMLESQTESPLKHALSPEVQPIFDSQIKQLHVHAAERLKHPLPDCSEPCFTYIPVAVKAEQK